VKTISRPEDLDAAFVGEALKRAGALPAGRVAAVRTEVIGTGKMADNVRCVLELEGAPADAPTSVVAKLAAVDPTSRQAGVGGGAYRREVRFYQELAPRIGMRTPRCYFADIDEASGDFVILMEDMTPAGPGDQIAGCDLDVAAVAVAEAVGLHAPFWGDDSLAAIDWLTVNSPEGAQFAQALLQQFWPGFCERFGDGLDAEQVALGQRFVDGYAAWSAAYDGPLALIHADYRLENMLLAPKGAAPDVAPIAVVDWQTAAQGCGVADVAYFLGGGLSIEDRRAHERKLLDDYCGRLRAAGVALDDASGWELYRRFTLHGVLITILGAMVTGQDPRGDRMFLAMAQRHLQHALDLGEEFVP
jgi:hypothetical protein